LNLGELMMRSLSWLAAGTLMLMLVAPAQALTVDSGAVDWLWGYDGTFTGGDAAGGTIGGVAHLTDFTLNVGEGSGANDLRAVVLQVIGGIPTGTVLWESASFSVAALTELVFAPDIDILSGGSVFIGIDSGLFTGAGGGDFVVGVTTDSGQVPGGGYWENTDDFFSPGFIVAVNTCPVTLNRIE
jgi:hypothetical protein